ncbi:DUF6760 family protein [Paenibacillus sabuli]|uniref:DUF6760 family protein n=1 Tax=Paenibacillus sabuli TaxID=2772509 RepID=UPI0037CB9E03
MRGGRRFFVRNVKPPTRYPEERLYEEIGFIAYYFHWSHDEIMNMEHRERRKWCEEISRINRKLSEDTEKPNVFDVFTKR